MGSYLRPTTIDEALGAMADGACTVLAGGTDFYPARVGRQPVEDILDITALAELRGIAENEDGWRIGALTTWTDIVRTELPALFDGLKLAAREVGGVQIQNAGTVCGNVCNASPAADGVPPLLAMDATVEIAARGRRRVSPLAAFVTGNRQTQLQADELVVGLRIPRPRRAARSTFLKLGSRSYLVISIAMVAACIESDGGRVAAARVAVGACSAVAQRLPALEMALLGHVVTPDLQDCATADHLAPLTPIDDVRGTGIYRRDAALTMVRRALRTLGSDA